MTGIIIVEAVATSPNGEKTKVCVRDRFTEHMPRYEVFVEGGMLDNGDECRCVHDLDIATSIVARQVAVACRGD
jgi:hypothetical protein